MMNRLEAAARQALENSQPSFMAPGWRLVLNEDITALREALAQQQATESDRSGCAAGSDEECTNRHCATKCPALAEQQAAEPVAQKPYAYEYGVDNGDGTYSIRIDRGSLIHTGVQYEYCAPRNPHPEHPVKPLYTHPAPTRQPLTDEMVTAAAREFCKIYAGECQVNEQDTWKLYGDQFKRDAQAMLEAAHGITSKELGAA